MKAGEIVPSKGGFQNRCKPLWIRLSLIFLLESSVLTLHSGCIHSLVVKMRYSLVRQHSEEDCGAACLATVAKHYGRTFALSPVREPFGTG